MKKTIIFGSTVIICGLLITLGPIYLFKACAPGCCSAYPECIYAVQAELAMGMIITALGIFFFVYNDSKTQMGMTIGIFLTSIMVILIPHVIIGGCAIRTMECNILTYPILTVLGVFVLVFSGIKFLSLRKQQ
jgi:hypothetical protein